MRKTGIFLFMGLFLLAGVFTVTGEVHAGSGTGDGSGGGRNNPLEIVSSVPADGASGVENLEAITVTFSKNVVYMTVRKSNQQCFSLWQGTERIPTEIIMADDQVERDKRHDVVIKPLSPLEPGTAYRVEIAPAMESKSGVTLGTKKTINFTTAGSKTIPVPDSVPSAAITGPESKATAELPDEAELVLAFKTEEPPAAGDTSAVTETGGVDVAPIVDKEDEQEPSASLQSGVPADGDKTLIEEPVPADPMEQIKKAGLWIIVIGLFILSAGKIYRRWGKSAGE